MTEQDLNGHYCLATEEHFDKLVEDGYEYLARFTEPTYYYISDKSFYTIAIALAGLQDPMHLHNNEWVFGTLEPILCKFKGEEGYATQEFINDHSAEELAHMTGSLEHEETYEHGVDVEPKPVERITREIADQELYELCDENLVNETEEYVNKLFDYIEYLEANQKEK